VFDLSLADAAIVFLGNFFVVFLLGLQSRNVQAGRYLAAVLVSAGINISNFIFVKYAAAGAADVLFISTLGGCSGIACAIWFYQSVIERKFNMATKKPTKPAGPNPKEVTEKVSRSNGHTDISKKGDLRESGTQLPATKKAKK
jgi:hypothetical protein